MPTKRYTADELNKLSKDDMVSMVLQLQNQVAFFEERLSASRANQFGQKTETLDQLSLFNEAEAEANENAAEPEVVEVRSNGKKKGKRKYDLSKLPRQIVPHDVPAEVLQEIFGDNKLKDMPDEIYYKVEYHPAWQEVFEHHIKVYSGKSKDTGERTVVKAVHPVDAISNSIATPSLIASVMNAKYVNAMPLYRIEQEFGRQDLKISRQNMANWMILCADRYLVRVYDLLHKKLCSYPVVQADETPVKVAKECKDDGTPRQKAYMHVYRTCEFQKDQTIVLYKYAASRGHQVAAEFLKGFEGYLESDAFSGYKALEEENPKIESSFCWAHARRDFANAIKALKPEEKELAKGSVAETALQKIAEIYRIENTLKELSPEERLNRRQTELAPLVEDYFAWVKQQDPDTILSEYTKDGLKYSLNQERQLRTFLKDGNIPIDNSATERAIRPFTTGRANWHMIDTPKGAEASAVIYSLVETAKANDLKPYKWLELLLSEIPEHLYSGKYDPDDEAYLEALLPWSETLPADCRKTQ